MKAFLGGMVALILISAGAGIVLTETASRSATTHSSDSVRLGE